MIAKLGKQGGGKGYCEDVSRWARGAVALGALQGEEPNVEAPTEGAPFIVAVRGKDVLEDHVGGVGHPPPGRRGSGRGNREGGSQKKEGWSLVGPHRCFKRGIGSLHKLARVGPVISLERGDITLHYAP